MRVEVIDSVEGRIVTRYAVDVKIDLQDEGKTLKIFISPQHTDDTLSVREQFQAAVAGEPIVEPGFMAIYTDRAGNVIDLLDGGSNYDR